MMPRVTLMCATLVIAGCQHTVLTAQDDASYQARAEAAFELLNTSFPASKPDPRAIVLKQSAMALSAAPDGSSCLGIESVEGEEPSVSIFDEAECHERIEEIGRERELHPTSIATIVTQVSAGVSGQKQALALPRPANAIWSNMHYSYMPGEGAEYDCVLIRSNEQSAEEPETGDAVFCSILGHIASTDFAQYEKDWPSAALQIETVITTLATTPARKKK